ncbi:hypothetical protein BN2476_250073 [Paraburkholderia piptadeniae]|uniref:Uncharacterized protein n=1 Tax=Paraburkholderia piptadeniae TaxID=1701573 RepID=A0A1N7S1E4_9BURK|nr:hypothetical protein BN2476_250073 [Paraburkholderia piptadeniae]
MPRTDHFQGISITKTRLGVALLVTPITATNVIPVTMMTVAAACSSRTGRDGPDAARTQRVDSRSGTPGLSSAY